MSFHSKGADLAKADNFRLEFWPEKTLPLDMEKIVESRLKLNIEPEPDLLSELDIDAYLRVDLTGIIVDHGAVLSSISPTLCRPFGVSDQVIERRVEREGLWPPKY